MEKVTGPSRFHFSSSNYRPTQSYCKRLWLKSILLSVLHKYLSAVLKGSLMSPLACHRRADHPPHTVGLSSALPQHQSHPQAHPAQLRQIFVLPRLRSLMGSKSLYDFQNDSKFMLSPWRSIYQEGLKMHLFSILYDSVLSKHGFFRHVKKKFIVVAKSFRILFKKLESTIAL